MMEYDSYFRSKRMNDWGECLNSTRDLPDKIAIAKLEEFERNDPIEYDDTKKWPLGEIVIKPKKKFEHIRDFLDEIKFDELFHFSRTQNSKSKSVDLKFDVKYLVRSEFSKASTGLFDYFEKNLFLQGK